MDLSISNGIGAGDNAETPMLENCVVNGAVDYKGLPAARASSGGWRSAAFIIGAEFGERFAYYAISANLITYLTGPLRQSTAAAAANVNAWGGVALVMPLLGAFVADSFLGRFRTIAFSSLLYVVGLGLLTLSAILSSLSGSDCQTNDIMSCSPSLFQVILFFLALYLVAFAQGGHKRCIQAFGADQFDGEDPEECKAKSSFFNWLCFGISMASLVTTSIVSYIQDNLSWALGFGIPSISMVVALIIFLLGTTTYRFSISHNEKGPFVRIGRVFVAAFWNCRRAPSSIATEVEILHRQKSEQYNFLDKALIAPCHLKEDDWWVCSVAEVQEAKAVLRLIPILGTCLIYGIFYAQPGTFFTKQGATMERTIVSGFKIPAASLQCFISIAMLTFIPIYDRVFVPFARAFTRKPSGITALQRIGAGIFLSVFTMVIAALVEIKRLNTAKEYNLVDKPDVLIPMSVWWLVPQYILYGITVVLTMVGLQEFFYDQVPTELRSIGIALYHCIFGVGSFLSSFLVTVIDNATGGSGRHSWFSNNLNRGHLDYFYWLLAGLSAVGFAAYFHFARSYIYNKRETM